MSTQYMHQKDAFWVQPEQVERVPVFQKLIHSLMKHGKKQKAFALLLRAVQVSRQKLQAQLGGRGAGSGMDARPLHDFQFLAQAIENVRPSVEVRSKKIAGISREIPCLVPAGRGQGLAIRWIIDAARARKKTGNRGFADNLAEELVDAYMQRGLPRQKRDTLHKTAATNRAYLRYRWW